MFRIILTCPQETQSQIINKIKTTPLAQHQKAPPTKNGYKIFGLVVLSNIIF